MRQSRFTEDQITGVLREHEVGVKTADLCREHGISDATFHTWKSKYRGLTVSGSARLRALEDETEDVAGGVDVRRVGVEGSAGKNWPGLWSATLRWRS